MEIIDNYNDLILFLKNTKGKSKSLVPTMGNLHDGHLSLVSMAKKISDIVIVTIFVNKLQFSQGEDYEKYPRTLENDIEKLKKMDIDLLFCPKNSIEVFGKDYFLQFSMPELTNCLCGAIRPNFFNGVMSVCMRFFTIIQPDYAIFGLKDYQQYKVIQKMTENLHLNVKILPHEIIREKNGLAMSSRNNYLPIELREKAGFIYEIISTIKDIEIAKKELIKNGIEKIDYLEIRNENLQLSHSGIVFFAGFYGGVRLIDNSFIQQP